MVLPLKSKNKVSSQIHADVPAELKRGIKRAAKKTGYSESDIVRSLIYNFCKSIDAIEPIPQLEDSNDLI